MKTYLVAYAATGLAFLVLDALWLSKMGPAFYKPAMGDAALEGFRIAPAVVFYFLYLVGIMIFAITPGAGRRPLDHGAPLRRAVRLLRLCHLRPHQPGDAEELEHRAFGGRHRLGLVRYRNGRHRRLSRHRLVRPLAVRRPGRRQTAARQ